MKIRANQRRLAAITLLGIIVVLIIFTAVVAVSSWFDSNRIVFESLQVNVRMPSVRVEKRPIISPIVQVMYDYGNVEVDTPIKEYVCQKFGEDCRIALAVVQCESGWNENAYNINTNGTVDASIWMLNSIHWDRFGGITKITDSYYATDVAHQLYTEAGGTFTPWVATRTQCFVNALAQY